MIHHYNIDKKKDKIERYYINRNDYTITDENGEEKEFDSHIKESISKYFN